MQTSSNNFNNNNNANKILQDINELFTTKNVVYQNNNPPNPFNVGNNQIFKNYNNLCPYYTKDIQNQNKIFNSNQNPINNAINFQNNNINEDNFENLNINNELMSHNISSIENIGFGQSPIFEKDSNSFLFGKNSNEDYKLYQQLVENNKTSLDKQILQNYQKNLNDNSKINKNLANVNQNFNNNSNLISSDNKIINLVKVNGKKEKIISITKFNNINNNNEPEKKSISEDIRNKLEKINITEMNPEWFKNEDNYKDPLYFEKLKRFEFERMGIKILHLSDFLIGKKLGSGQFGRVYLVKYKPTQFICTLKILNKKRLLMGDIKSLNQVRREIEIQSHLHHKNILSIYNFFWDKKNIYLVMEYAPGGELYETLQEEENRRFSEPRAAFYINQVCDAIEYIQKFHIIHRDIKPENILLSNEVIKLADFGASIHQKSSKYRPTFCGTAEYLPPEVINDQPHIPSSDLWCLGILIFELCSGESPFTAKTYKEIRYRIKNYKMKKFPDYFSHEVKDLIGKLLQMTPNDRITIQEVKQHPWIIKNSKKYINN